MEPREVGQGSRDMGSHGVGTGSEVTQRKEGRVDGESTKEETSCLRDLLRRIKVPTSVRRTIPIVTCRPSTRGPVFRCHRRVDSRIRQEIG